VIVLGSSKKNNLALTEDDPTHHPNTAKDKHIHLVKAEDYRNNNSDIIITD